MKSSWVATRNSTGRNFGRTLQLDDARRRNFSQRRNWQAATVKLYQAKAIGPTGSVVDVVPFFADTADDAKSRARGFAPSLDVELWLSGLLVERLSSTSKIARAS